MDGRSTYLGKTFLFPQEQQQRQVSGGRSASGGLAPDKFDEYFGIPKPAEDLQYTGEVRDKARQYFQDLAALRQFAREQWTRYGNDVTAPDPSREDSVMAAQAFQAGIGNLMATADELKVSQKMLTPAFQAYTQNQYAFSPESFNQPFAQVAGTQAGGYSTQVDPLVKFYGEEVGRQFDDPRRYAQAQGQAQALQQQTAGLTGPMGERTKLAAQAIIPDIQRFAPREGGSAAKQSVFEFLKRASAVSKGVSDYNISKKYADPDTGESLAGTKEFNDAFEGVDRRSGKEVKGVIQEVLRNPTSGKMYLKLSTQEDLIPVSMTEFVYGISKANPKYPGVDKISAYVGEVGASDMAGNIIPDKFLEPRAIQSAQEKEKQLTETGKQVSNQVNAILGEIDKIDTSGGWSRFFGLADGIEVNSDYGKMKLRKNSDGTFDIVNRNEVIPTTEDFTDQDRERIFSNIPLSTLKQMIRKYNMSTSSVRTPIKSSADRVSEWTPDNEYVVNGKTYYFDNTTNKWAVR